MRNITLIAAIALLTINTSAQVGSVHVKTWADDKKAAFSFSFDDSYISHYETARPVLNSFGFKGTFYLISGFITETLPGSWRYGTWEQFREMAAEGHEMGAHTVTHPDLTTLAEGDNNTPNSLRYELYQSKMTIEQKIPGVKVTTIAYPYIEHDSFVESITDNYYEAARAGGNTLNPIVLNIQDRLGLQAKKVEFNLPRNSVQDDNDEMQNFKTYLTNAVNQGKWGIIMIHEVYPFSKIPWALNQGSYYPLSAEWLTELCQYLKQKSDVQDVWVETIANITKYSRERETFNSSIISVTDSVIKISVTDGMDNDLYDYPLTTDVVVPSSWDTVYVTVNGTEIKMATSLSGPEKIVRINVIPDRGELILRKNKVTAPVNKYNITGKIVYNNVDQSPMPGIGVSLNSASGANSGNTDAGGLFSFVNKSEGAYTLAFSNPGSAKGISATDALAAVLYFTGSLELDSLQQLAADVTDDGKINSTDALQILRRVSGLIDSFTIPEWIFDPDPISINLSGSSVNYNIKAISAGDINVSFKP